MSPNTLEKETEMRTCDRRVLLREQKQREQEQLLVGSPTGRPSIIDKRGVVDNNLAVFNWSIKNSAHFRAYVLEADLK